MRQGATTRPAAPPAAAPGRPTPTVPEAVRVQMLATEHWSLLATRSLLWTEAFTRAGIYLTTLSAGAVALALVAQMSGTRDTFLLFSVLLLPVLLFLGLATYVRIVHINNEDGRLLLGMNLLRRGYLDIAPELEPYFITGSHDDMRGLQQTMGLDDDFGKDFVLKVLVSTPGVVAVINCVVAGVLSGLIGRSLDLSRVVSALIGLVVALVLLAAHVAGPVRYVKRWSRGYQPRFPS